MYLFKTGGGNERGTPLRIGVTYEDSLGPSGISLITPIGTIWVG